MDKNYWTALILSMVILLGYPYVLRKTGVWKSPAPQPAAAKQSGTTAQPEQAAASPALSEPVIQNAVPAALIQDKTPAYEAEFSTLGATVTRLKYLGEADKPDKTSNVFFEGDPASPGLFGLRVLHDEIDLSRSVFKPAPSNDGSRTFVFERSGRYKLTKKYTMDPEKPVIRLEVTLENLAAIEQNFALEFEYGLNYAQDDRQAEAVVLADKIISANAHKISKKGFSVSDKISWGGVLKKYFSVLVRPDWQVISAEGKTSGGLLSETLRMEPVTVKAGEKSTRSFLIYAGPQKYEFLKQYDFDAVFSKGLLGFFKIWLLFALKFFYGFTHNYGWSIILLTCVIKLLFTPLTHISYESMKKMQAIQPKVKSLQERYKNDPQKLNKEMMELYKRNKVNPMGGCLPMLLQIPIFISFYSVLNEAIELKGSHFIGWINDLAQPDKLFTLPFTLPILGEHFNLLPFFMIASMVWQQKLMPQTASSPEQQQVTQFMPIIFGVMFYQMPSGLVLYWFVNNALTILHQVFIKRMVVVLHHEDRD